jgi:hypothetical protein
MYSNFENNLGPLAPCVKCKHLGVACFGSNMDAAKFPQVIAWCLARKKYFGINNNAIADGSGISTHTVNKLFTGNLDSCNHDSIARIVRYLVDPTGKAEFGTCPLCKEETPLTETEKAALLSKIQQLETKLATADDRAEVQLARALQDKQQTIDNLKEQIADHRANSTHRERSIRVLSALLGLALLAIIALLWFR